VDFASSATARTRVFFVLFSCLPNDPPFRLLIYLLSTLVFEFLCWLNLAVQEFDRHFIGELTFREIEFSRKCVSQFLAVLCLALFVCPGMTNITTLLLYLCCLITVIIYSYNTLPLVRIIRKRK